MSNPLPNSATFESRYLSGAELYGDDFSPAEVAAWFEDEREGYAELGANEGDGSGYSYHQLNIRHGFRWLPPGRRFESALGVGAAYGAEFEPVADRLDEVTILEPSDQLVGTAIGDIEPVYFKPKPNGLMPFADAAFDLTVCFGTLHHIPNVSAVLGEIGRVTKSGGYALIREPIVSMGDWRGTRKAGITKRERGIPMHLLRQMVEASGFRIERAKVCVFPLMPRVGRVLHRPQYNSPFLTAVDEVASLVTRPLYRYHATTVAQKIRPTSLFVVARKR